jgi:hypothetical protein
MSDIFTNLVLRNGGMPSPAILQPRLPSLFESTNRVEGLSEPMSAQAETGSFTASTESTYQHINLSSTEQSPFTPNLDSIKEPSLIPTPFDRPPFEHLKERQSLDPKRPSIDPLSSLEQQGSTRSRLFQTSTVITHDEGGLVDMNRRRAETVMNGEDQTVGRKSSKDVQQTTGKSAERVVYPRVDSVTPLHNDAQRSETRSPMVKRSLEKPSNVILPREKEMEIESPVVQIHIGRIEVRAVMPPPTQPVTKAAPAQPRMTLDDYLRQREGRR